MEEIGLQELINQVKQELLTPPVVGAAEDDVPLFVIDRIDLEINVKVTKAANGGVKLSVLSFAELSAGGSLGGERGNVIKVSLSPLVAREALIAQALQDPQQAANIRKTLQEALVKGDAGLMGEPE